MPNPPKPTERKRKAGTLRGDRMPKAPVKAEVVPLPTRAPIPEHLGHAGASAYRLILSACEGWLGVGDQMMVLHLAEAADRRTDLIERLNSEGPVLYTDKGYAYANPAAGMLSTLEVQMTKWQSLLGLTPTDRARLGLVEVKRVSKLDELRKARSN